MQSKKIKAKHSQLSYIQNIADDQHPEVSVLGKTKFLSILLLDYLFSMKYVFQSSVNTVEKHILKYPVRYYFDRREFGRRCFGDLILKYVYEYSLVVCLYWYIKDLVCINHIYRYSCVQVGMYTYVARWQNF